MCMSDDLASGQVCEEKENDISEESSVRRQLNMNDIGMCAPYCERQSEDRPGTHENIPSGDLSDPFGPVARSGIVYKQHTMLLKSSSHILQIDRHPSRRGRQRAYHEDMWARGKVAHLKTF